MKFKRTRGGAWGAWYSDGRYARCAVRYRDTLGYQCNGVGFRCCFSPFFVIKRKARK